MASPALQVIPQWGTDADAFLESHELLAIIDPLTPHGFVFEAFKVSFKRFEGALLDIGQGIHFEVDFLGSEKLSS